jgi:hypothetical protein
LRLRSSRSRGSSVLAVVGGCLGAYAVFAVAFHWLVEPTVKNQAVAPYEASLARAVQSSATSFVTPARPDLPSRVTSKPPASATVAARAPKSTEPARSEPPSRVPPPPMTVTAASPKPAESARAEARVPPPMMAAPKPTETAQSTAPSSAAAEPPMTTAGPAPKETSEQPSRVVSESAASSAAAQESAETAPAPKKKKVARKTPRHDRPREFWNPMNFFAWGSPYGARRSF